MINLSEITYVDIFFAWLSVVSTTLFIWATFSLKRTHEKIKEIKEQEEKRWKDLEDKAQRDYQEVLEAANKKAQEIILQATQISHESTINLQNSMDRMLNNQNTALRQISKSLSRKHEEQVNQIIENSIKILTNTYKNIELTTNSDFEKYKEDIQKQTFEAHTVAQQRIKQEYEKLEIEINQLKEKRLQELNSTIDNIIQNISKEVIGKSLNLSDQEDLIIKALDQAKKDKIL